jgi:UDP-N-acetylglucosamine--N-acetylmuramyl-(pentapeptide) pyrophosphoryl-undecaprenol N-acetylglucosamine transferase
LSERRAASRRERCRGAALVPLSLADAWRTLSARRPHLVIGVGGYSSGPVVLMAALRRIPTLLLEQNVEPGLTNRLLAPIVRAAAVTFEATKTYYGSRAFVSGNPVRPEFLTPAVQAEESGAHDQASGIGVLVFGGSQGSHAINLAMVAASEELAASGVRLRITHQTGERDVEIVRSAYSRAGLQAEVAPFLYDMGARLRTADLVVCRSGATTLAEIEAVGRPAILIPLPTATDDHQRRNAEAMAAAGAAQLLLEKNATGRELARRIVGLARDAEARAGMARAARALARPDAARVIVERALELVGG